MGGSAAVVNWLIFFLSIQILHLHYLFAGLISFVLATLWNFVFARLFIFKNSKHSLVLESTLVYLVSLGGLLIDMGVLYICVDGLSIHVMLAKILATGIAFVFNFSLRQFVIYKS